MFLGSSHKFLERSAEKIMSDCLEALIGAIYMDSGLKAAEKFVLNFWKRYLQNSKLPLIDSKTQLQEYSLKRFKQLPKYTFHKKTGPQHRPFFKTDVEIPNSKKAVGTGTSKKNAQQNAAKKLLQSLENL
jgi:dsRNA-specific ribonuclease